ncbi:SET domain and MYND-type zinc finger protein 6 [Psilocybe cubensis]|uniref:SET domain and MYND-type zinc finger protein 6 n=1 Tax=Psilocybe cubensis TaxID=181762 RepID=A0ACB8GNS3_PSICU|nr:SET domain and MYND-type zinc finger protein 6 [Psilocybe cubensis]KAH9476689.1 SET domain and MYND-type zinc finger protein 6 [Psilocybe cubensis]
MSYGLMALDLHRNMARWENEVFHVIVHPWPGESNPRLDQTFLAIDAKPRRIDELHEVHELGIRQELEKLKAEVKGDKQLCGMVVITTDIESMISITWPIAFTDVLPAIPPGVDADDGKNLYLSKPPSSQNQHREMDLAPASTGPLPYGWLRKSMMQCIKYRKQPLWDGVTLSKCASCQTTHYCSKSCQKADWPVHKTTCSKFRDILQADASAPEDARIQKALHLFANKHKSVLGTYGVIAMDFRFDVTRGLRDAVAVFLKYVPNEKRTDQAFKAIHAAVVPFELFGVEREEYLREESRKLHDEVKGTRTIGCVLVVCFTVDSGLIHVSPMSFGNREGHVDNGNDQRLENLLD